MNSVNVAKKNPADTWKRKVAVMIARIAIWASMRNPIRYAWEIQKARNSETNPDPGARARLDFTAPKGSPAREDVDKSH
jgi:hypothetical protein